MLLNLHWHQVAFCAKTVIGLMTPWYQACHWQLCSLVNYLDNRTAFSYLIKGLINYFVVFRS